MADDLDLAAEREQRFREDALKQALGRPLEVEPTGICANCEAPLAEGMRFCDSDCRDDHAARNRARALRGHAP